jgi:hypothetical protein
MLLYFFYVSYNLLKLDLRVQFFENLAILETASPQYVKELDGKIEILKFFNFF